MKRMLNELITKRSEMYFVTKTQKEAQNGIYPINNFLTKFSQRKANLLCRIHKRTQGKLLYLVKEVHILNKNSGD